MASITIQDMDITYNKGKTKVINGVNLEIEDGEFCVFLGPSGCGKSTAMYSIAGLLHPSRGKISFGDEVMTEVNDKGKDKTFVPPQERNIAMVFQEYALYPNMTVRRNMSFALETKKASKAEIDKRVTAMSSMLGLDELLDRRPAQLSGGQRQRVALGRALVRDPQVFLLDEPLGNLDAKLRDQVRYELKKIQTKLGITTVYVTHDQTEAMTMADHIVLMKDGRIMQQGTPNDLYSHPNCLFAASFVGTPQINKLQCRVVSEEGNIKLVCDQLVLNAPDDVKELLRLYEGKEVIIGIRPSELALAPEGQGELNGIVDSVEPLGDGFHVYLNVDGQVLVAKIAGGSTVIGKTLSLNIENGKMHIFDSVTEERLNIG
ncbi:MAG: ABC transporter ATP-binding protein [Eubacteriales bacterium]|nr:ABC transporter ATP-binding protein [Eubacteriales bacterium]